MIDVKTDLTLAIQDNFRLKHLAGQHDQKLHGIWAGDPKKRMGRPSWLSSGKFDRQIPEGIDPVPVTPELKAILGGSMGLDEAHYIQGWSNFIEEKTGLKVLDFTSSIEMYYSIPGYDDALGSQDETDNSIDLVKLEYGDRMIMDDSSGTRQEFSGAAIFIHEFGHAVYTRCWARGNHGIERYIDKLMTEDGFDAFTSYSKTNEKESFSESFVLYLAAGGKKRIKTKTPRRAEKVFRVIDQVINEHERYLRENQTG